MGDMLASHKPNKAGVVETHIVGLDCAERKVLCRNGDLGQHVKQCALAHIGQPNNAHLQGQQHRHLAHAAGFGAQTWHGHRLTQAGTQTRSCAA